MTFSIIVPVYNTEKYLPACVESVLRQEDPDYELILVDDGSDAPCAKLCGDLASNSPQIRLLRQENAGQLFARINGVAAAKGAYCLFLDADDLLEPTCLKTLKEAVVKHREPDMLVYSYLRVEANGEQLPGPLLFSEEREFSGDSLRDFSAMFLTSTALNNVWTKAVKREVFSGEFPDYRPFAKLRVSEDRLFSMGLVSNAERIVYLPKPLYRYRIFPGSVTRHYSPEAADRFNVSILYPCELDYLRRWGLLNEENRLRLQAQYIAQTLYVFDLLYRNIPNAAERDRLIEYPWREHIPDACVAAYPGNPFLNDVQKRLFAQLLAGDGRAVRSHFRKKLLRSF